MKVESTKEACELRGYDQQQIEAAAAMMPPALQKFIRAAALRAVVIEAINEGKIPDPNDGKWKYEPIFDLTQAGPAGLGLAFDSTCHWYTNTFVGARLQILDSNDARFFAEHPEYQQLHHDALTYKPLPITKDEKN